MAIDLDGIRKVLKEIPRGGGECERHGAEHIRCCDHICCGCVEELISKADAVVAEIDQARRYVTTDATRRTLGPSLRRFDG